MKRATIFNLLLVGVLFTLGATACKKKPNGITHIPGQTGLRSDRPNNLADGVYLPPPTDLVRDNITDTTAMPDRGSIEGRPQNRSMFEAQTVYFALDSSSVSPEEQSKLETVANHFRSNPAGDLLIEGHCDERGTEGYNLTLGDKRANALREYLVNLGVSPDRIHTVSFGEAKPAAVGTDESAYSRNRRGEFILIEPAQ